MNGVHIITDSNKIKLLSAVILYVGKNFKLKEHYFSENQYEKDSNDYIYK